MENAEETLKALTETIVENLRELNDLEENPFISGEKHAYVECLEIIQDIWEHARQNELDFEGMSRKVCKFFGLD